MANCELLEKCPFFKEYKGGSDTVVAGFTRIYCANQEKSQTCERKKYRQKNGNPPPVNMAPTGTMLPK